MWQSGTTAPEIVYSAEESAAMDVWLIEERGFTLEGLMASAGERLAEAARAFAGETGCTRVVVLAGPGHNGGDARVAEGLLRDEFETELWQPLEAPGAPRLDEQTLLVDGLFGVGLVRPIGGSARQAVEHVHMGAARELSVDVPSGLHATTGEVLGAAHGGVAVRAERTLTFVGPKAGFFVGQGPAHVGRWMAVEIGFPAEEAEAWVRDRRRR